MMIIRQPQLCKRLNLAGDDPRQMGRIDQVCKAVFDFDPQVGVFQQDFEHSRMVAGRRPLG